MLLSPFSVPMCLLHVQPIQTEIGEHGAIISSNGKNKVTITEVQEHLMMPDYPETSNEGVLHFIHSKNPIDQNPSEDRSFREGPSPGLYSRDVEGAYFVQDAFLKL